MSSPSPSPSAPRVSTDSTSSPLSSSSPHAPQAYPFPSSPDLHRPSSTNRYAPRRGSTSSTLSAHSVSTSVGGSLDTQLAHHRRGNSYINKGDSINGDIVGHSIHDSSRNGISTLLQPPILRTGHLPHTSASLSASSASGFKAPTSKDIPPVALSNIPHIPPDTFRDYLQRITPLFASFQRGRAEPEQASRLWAKHAREDGEREKTERFAAALDRRGRGGDGNKGGPEYALDSTSTTLSPSLVETPGKSGVIDGSSSAHWRRRRRDRHSPTPLSTIPTVYFDEDFHLENPRTFDIVSERAEIVRPPPGTPIPPTTEELSKASINNVTSLAPRKALATNAILQEKLSWYMDTVEVHLIGSISTASTGFFAALASLKELQSEAEHSVAQIQALRNDLRKLDQEVAVAGLEVAAKKLRRANVRRLHQATRQVQRVVDDVNKADAMVDEGLYDEATDQVERVSRLVSGQPELSSLSNGHQQPSQDSPQLIDLRPLQALSTLPTALSSLRNRISTGLSQRVTSLLITDLRQHVSSVPSTQTLKRWSRQRGLPPPTYLEIPSSLREELRAVLSSLARVGGTQAAAAAYSEAVKAEMKALIRQFLPSSSDDDVESVASSVATSTLTERGGRGKGLLSQQEKSAILARNLRALDPADAEGLLVKTYTAVGEAFRRVGAQTKVLLDVTSGMVAVDVGTGVAARAVNSPQQSHDGSRGSGSSRPSLDMGRASGTATPTPQQHARTRSAMISSPTTSTSGALPAPSTTTTLSPIPPLDLSTPLLTLAVDTVQTQITRILKVRSAPTLQLPQARFLRYFTLNRLFADECEAVSGRSGEALRDVIEVQIKDWVKELGARLREEVVKGLETESWGAVDFGVREEGLLARVLGSAGAGGKRHTEVVPIWDELDDDGLYSGAERVLANGGLASEVNGTATPPTTAATTTTPPPPTTNGTNPAAPAKPLHPRPAIVASQKYILTLSAIALLPLLDTLLSLTAVLGPSQTPALAACMLDLLRTFNSRSCQLILGAGATKSAGLKNITTKHLALASQSVGFVVALLPGLREAVGRRLPSSSISSSPPATLPSTSASGGGGAGGGVSAAGGQAASQQNVGATISADFDKTKRLCQDHQAGIYDKLVEIMTSRSLAHVKTLGAMDLDAVLPTHAEKKAAAQSDKAAPAPAAPEEVDEDDGKLILSPYMEILTKETLTLHRVLARFLLSEGDVVGMIMRRIFAEYQIQWSEAFALAVARVKSEAGRKRLERDVLGFERRLGKVQGFGETGRKVAEGLGVKGVKGGGLT